MDLFESTFDHVDDIRFPVGATKYVEGDLTNKDDIPFWLSTKKEIWGEDLHGRRVAVTGPKAWVNQRNNARVVGVTPLIFWERYEDSDHPVMVWKPGAEHDLVVPKRERQSVIDSAACHDRFGTSFEPGGNGSPFTFRHAEGKEMESTGAVHVPNDPKKEASLLAGDSRFLNVWVEVDDRIETPEDEALI